MKTYRSAPQLLADIRKVLSSAKPTAHESPLEEVIELLFQGRHYTWVGIYLAVGSKKPGQLLGEGKNAQPGHVTLPDTRSKLLVSMKIAAREFGVLGVETDRETAFGLGDRIFLENVASALARFLAGPGKYIVRKARGLRAEPAKNSTPAKASTGKKQAATR